MAYRDLRDWLAAVEHDGELKRISGASWDLEMSGISEITHQKGIRPVPALLFDNIPGYPKGFRVLFGLLSSLRRIARTLYLSPSDEDLEALAILRSWMSKAQNLKPIAPEPVSSGPVQENHFSGDKVDLTIFPTPRCHELDGGRYIGTGNVVITRDPDTGWVNLGVYRCMLVDHNRIALHMLEG